VLLALSFLNIWFQTFAARGYPDGYVINPLFDSAIPSFLHGTVALSIGTALMAPFVGINSQLTLLPLPLIVGLWTLLCARPDRKARVQESAVLVAGSKASG
jgi:hypothetical protein